MANFEDVNRELLRQGGWSGDRGGGPPFAAAPWARPGSGGGQQSDAARNVEQVAREAYRGAEQARGVTPDPEPAPGPPLPPDAPMMQRLTRWAQQPTVAEMLWVGGLLLLRGVLYFLYRRRPRSLDPWL